MVLMSDDEIVQAVRKLENKLRNHEISFSEFEDELDRIL